ncbi:MAG TPA: SagB/ThcOx family dehydrogenase [Candidatus Margulisiibacteriota bacterium]|nr:SagB/ThcOx family dehydrogenase [Candidatus Margulisiibacteriota bacterium]
MILILFLVFPGLVYSQELKAIKLPEPKMQGGMPLMQALRERKSVREFATRELPIEVISDMLWAGAGINRPESAHRTSPSSMNMQEIDIYLVKAEGVYLYDPQGNMLIPVVSGDIRVLTGAQDFVKDAPVDLVYVADLARMGKVSPQDADSTAGTDTGFISQNVYLYCASSGLATVVRGWLDRPALAKAMKLRPQQKIILAQTVGYPK